MLTRIRATVPQLTVMVTKAKQRRVMSDVIDDALADLGLRAIGLSPNGLGNTAHELQLPIAMIVTGAITDLLDQPPDTIATLVDRALSAAPDGWCPLAGRPLLPTPG